LPRKNFNTKEELLELLRKISFGELPEQWKWVRIYGHLEDKLFTSPIQVTIFLDRYPKDEPCVGYVYVHSSLNSYLGLKEDPIDWKKTIYPDKWKKELFKRDEDAKKDI
jgi:hypothetical protein